MENKKLDLIDRNALYEKAYFSGKLPDPGNLYPEGKEVVDVDDIDDAPSIDAVPVVHGYWAKHTVAGEDFFGSPALITWACNCSVCGLDGRTETPYCPHCGARMDGWYD